jgi:pyruvate/2-oxoglutarate dehydrogenase complex dihydrolipoamide dehydrogenase (E3) component
MGTAHCLPSIATASHSASSATIAASWILAVWRSTRRNACCFLNVGTHAAIPDVPGLKSARPLTHIEALDLDCLPSHLMVLGGGYVGLEMAQAYRRFGSRITVIEAGPRIMSREDADVAEELQRILVSGSMQLVLSAEVTHVRGRSGEDVAVTIRTPSGERAIEGSDRTRRRTDKHFR